MSPSPGVACAKLTDGGAAAKSSYRSAQRRAPTGVLVWSGGTPEVQVGSPKPTARTALDGPAARLGLLRRVLALGEATVDLNASAPIPRRSPHSRTSSRTGQVFGEVSQQSGSCVRRSTRRRPAKRLASEPRSGEVMSLPVSGTNTDCRGATSRLAWRCRPYAAVERSGLRFDVRRGASNVGTGQSARRLAPPLRRLGSNVVTTTF